MVNVETKPPPGGSGNAPYFLVATVVLALLAATATAASKDPLYQFQGWIFTLAFTIGSFVLAAGISAGTFSNPQDRYSDGVIKAGVIATMFWGAAGMLYTEAAVGAIGLILFLGVLGVSRTRSSA